MNLSKTDGRLIFSLDDDDSLDDVTMFIDDMQINDGVRRFCSPTNQNTGGEFYVTLPAYIAGERSDCELRFESSQGEISDTSLQLSSLSDYIGPTDVVGNLDYVDEYRINGWMQDPSLSGPVEFDVYVDGEYVESCEAVDQREDVYHHFGDTSYLNTGFDVTWNPDKSARTFELREKQTGRPLLGTPVRLTSTTDSVRFMEDAIKTSRQSGVINPFGSQEALDTIFDTVRRQPRYHLSYSPSKDPATHKKERGISIVIPVYNGFEVLKDCIDSLVQSDSKTPHEILVVNDCSPDERIRPYLQKAQSKISNLFVVERRANGGFVHSANLGLQARRFENVVLLNSDTIVPKFFVDRLAQSHQEAPDYGVLTPLSNNATIYSFPVSLEENEINGIEDVWRIDDVLASKSSGTVYEMPTGHGYCMFISGAVLEAVGPLDAQEWGIGYGEENDFCQKVKMSGWQIGALTNMYVGHVGSVSFGVELREEQLARNLSILGARYPEYDDLVREHIFNDSAFRMELNNLRIASMAEDLDSTGKMPVVFITHSLGGGTDEYISRTADGMERDNVLSLRMVVEADSQIVLEDMDQKYRCVYSPDEFSTLMTHLKSLGVIDIVLNSIFSLSFKYIDEILAHDIPFTAVIHDYSWICPRINLIDAREAFCGLPSADVCNTCIRVSGAHSAVSADWMGISVDVGAWREKSEKVLRAARMVICPSADAETRILSVLPNLNTVVRYHEDTFPIPVRVEEKVTTLRTKAISDQTFAIFGRIGNHKGMAVLKNLIWLLSSRHEGVKFVFYGELAEYSWLSGYKNVDFAGEYEKDSLSNLLSKSQPTVGLFLSVWPETYCYALTDAIRNAVFPVAFDIGAFKERMEMHEFGGVIPYTTDSEAIYDSIVDLLSSEEFLRSKSTAIKSGVHYESMLRDCFNFDEGTKAKSA